MVEWFFFLVEHDRVRVWHFAPPCRTFSLAFQPRVRSRQLPWGIDPASEALQIGNVLMSRCLAVMKAILVRGRRTASLEAPRHAYTWFLPLLRAWVAGGQMELVDFDACPFLWADLTGAQQRRCTSAEGAKEMKLYLKPFRLGVIGPNYLSPLHNRRCCGGHAHFTLVGGARTKASAQYPARLAKEWASLLKGFCEQGSAPLASSDLAEVQERGRPAFESLPLNQLLRGARFRELFE